MTAAGDALPTSPGSIAQDSQGRRYAAAHWAAGLTRWLPLTHFERTPPDPDQLAERDPTVLWTAPDPENLT